MAKGGFVRTWGISVFNWVLLLLFAVGHFSQATIVSGRMEEVKDVLTGSEGEPLKDTAEIELMGKAHLDGWGDQWLFDPWRVSLKRKCDSRFVLTSLEMSRTPRHFAQTLQQYQAECEGDLTSQAPQDILAILGIAQFEYPKTGVPGVQVVKFELKTKSDQSLVLRGVLGLKPSQRPLPLVIARCGIYCDTRSKSIARPMMQFFDEGPFHVLVLGSISGPQFVRDNGLFTFGGLEEGRQTYELARWLVSPDSPLRDKISEVHLFGESLGSHSVLYASVLDSLNSGQNLLFKSVIAMCPVLDLPATVQDVRSGGLITQLVYRIRTRQAVEGMMQGLSDEKVASLGLNVPLNDLFADLYNVALRNGWHFSRRWPLGYAPFSEPFSDVREYEKVLRVQPYLRYIRNPTLILSSNSDHLVTPRVNGHAISSEDLDGKKNLQIGRVDFEHGNHCGTSLAMGWSTFSRILNLFIWQNSSEMGRSHLRTITLPNLPSTRFPRRRNLHEAAKLAQEIVWRAYTGLPHFTLEVRLIHDAQFSGCPDPVYIQNLYPVCEDLETYYIPFEWFPKDLGLSIPKNGFEAQRLSRWASSNLTLQSLEPTHPESRGQRDIVRVRIGR